MSLAVQHVQGPTYRRSRNAVRRLAGLGTLPEVDDLVCAQVDANPSEWPDEYRGACQLHWQQNATNNRVTPTNPSGPSAPRGGPGAAVVLGVVVLGALALLSGGRRARR